MKILNTVLCVAAALLAVCSCIIVENFNDEPVDVRLVGNAGPLKLTDLETGESADPAMTLKPHSYRAFSY